MITQPDAPDFAVLQAGTANQPAGQFGFQARLAYVPEPPTFAMLFIGLIGIAGLAARRR